MKSVQQNKPNQDLPISIYIDNNVWDFLYERKLDLAAELPCEKFCICITREAEFEIPPIVNKNPELKRFIDDSIEKCLVKVDSFFGFYNESLPQNEQRVSGFNIGRFASQEEINFMIQQRIPLKKKHIIKNQKTKLYKEEADISIAARSFHSVVLSLDAKKGPINDAYRQGGKVVFLTDFDSSGMALSEFISYIISESN
ncbi:hypothetical protein [Aquitalea pelogenes]|uniref:hypothetical protein n=1 Tax=Aquitalea pelogenes TaxID=1293573 RepID=UPI0035AD9B7B